MKKNKCMCTCARNDCALSFSMSLVRQFSRVIQRAGEHSDSHSVVSASAVRISLTHPYPSHFCTPVSKRNQFLDSRLQPNSFQALSPSSWPLPEQRTGGDTPADEFLEMFRTTKLGPVTGNLSGLVLADISDTSLSTQEGFCFNQSPSWPAGSGWVARRIPTGLSSGVCSRKTGSLCVCVGGGCRGYASVQYYSVLCLPFLTVIVLCTQ